jgi:lysophospholipase L1-like esterase
MAAAGDSITRAFNLCFFPFTDCPAQSWSTGSNSTVNSHARRLSITNSAYNDAVSGARMVDFATQAGRIDSRNVKYVTVLMGGNDVCRDTEAEMTDPAVYEAQFRSGMDKLIADAPLVYVVSIPNVKVLWEIFKDNSSARSAWNSYNVCQSLLANPLSTNQVDIDRRERVKQRNMELNQRLRKVCAEYIFCRFDGEGVFGTRFETSDVSTRDYFHPSTSGQKKLAAVSYDLGYWPSTGDTKAVNLPPSASFTHSCSGLTCTFTDGSSDTNGLGGRSWQFGDGRTSTAATATHTFAAAGTYHVTLYSIDALGASSKVLGSISVSASEADTTPPAPPTGLGATAGDAQVALDWADNTDAVAGYRVYRSGTSGGSFTRISGDNPIPTSQYDDRSVENGTTYYYVVTAVDTAGNESASSAEASAMPQASTSGGSTTMHVVDLDGEATRATRGSSWTATVTIRAVDGNGAPLGSVEVAGDWGTGGSATCTTDAAGTCWVSVSLNSKKVDSTTFTVVRLSRDGYTYPGVNSDVEGDSNGTSILVRL